MVLLLNVALMLAACSTTTTRSSPTTTVAVPRGWKTYTFEQAAISVPADWAVEHNANCPDSQAPGTLMLGFPTVHVQCTGDSSSTYGVRVTPLSGGDETSASGGTKINGIPVEVGFGSPMNLQWSVSTLGVSITASGPLANRILHTLRRVT
jgi:hypothetical protein